MNSPRGRRVVVVGGGIVGSAVALALQERGVATTLVERDAVPQGASAHSFASLSAFDEGQKDVYLLKTLGMAGWRAWRARFGRDIGAAWDGDVRWAEDADGAAHLNALLERAARRGYPARRIARAELTSRLSEATPGELSAASLAPEDGQVDAVRAVGTLRNAFGDVGGTTLVGKASLSFDEGRVRVRVGDETTDASTVVVAAGAETGAVLERLGWEIPMDSSPGLLVVTGPQRALVRGTVYVHGRGGTTVHLRQREDGRVVIGERAQDHVATDPTKQHAEVLLRAAARAFPGLAGAAIERFTVEWRPMPRDGMPVVGQLPGLSPVYVVTAHSGVTLAPILGRLVADELVDGTPSPRLEPFRPARFAEHNADAYVSVEEAFKAPSELFLG